MHITSQLVAEQVWAQGRGGASRPGTPRGPLRDAIEDGRLLVLQFLCDGKRIERTPAWQDAGELLGAQVAAVLRRITTSRDALLLSIGGPSVEKRRLGKRAVRLDSAEHVLLDYALAGRSRCFAFYEQRAADYRHARLLVEPSRRDLAQVLRAGLGWGTTRAYVIPRPKVDLAMKAWSKAEDVAALTEIRTLSPYARIACEEWSDGGALRFWSTILDHRALARALGCTLVRTRHVRSSQVTGARRS